MRVLLLAVTGLMLTISCFAQNIYQIRADSVRIYNTCDTAELVLENRTQDTLGFLYNKGKGRTEFRRLQLQKIGNNQLAITGQDTLDLGATGDYYTRSESDNLFVPRRLVIERNMRKTFNKILLSQTSKQQIVVFPFGDSMAGQKMRYLGGAFGRTLIDGNEDDVPADTTVTYRYRAVGGACSTVGSGITNNSSDYQRSPSGQTITIQPGTTANFVIAGVNPTFTDLKIYYYKEPGAGSFVLNVGGAETTTINAANATDTVLGIYKFTQALDQKTVSIRVTNSPVTFYEVHYLDTTKSGIDLYNCSQGGIALNDMMKYNAAKRALVTYLADGDIDFMTYEMKEGLNYPDNTTYTQRLNQLSDLLDEAAPQAAKIFIGSTPVSGDNTSQKAQNDTLYKIANQRAYIFWDGYGPVKDYATMEALNWQGDGTHPAPRCQAYLASLLYKDLGIDNIVFGNAPRAVNDRSTASHLGSNTTIGEAAGREISFNTDAVFGQDWEIRSPRSLRFTDDDGSTVIAQFSSNTSVHPNVLPAWVRLGSPTAVQEAGYTTAGGVPAYRLINGSAPDSNMLFMAGAIRPGSYLTANLPLANVTKGALAYVRDAAGGARLMWARGNSNGDWQPVSSWSLGPNTNDIISNNPGQVGIGSANPQFQLHVYSEDTLGLAVQNGQALSATSGGALRMYGMGIPTTVDQRLGSIVWGVNTSGINYLTSPRIEALSEGAWNFGSSHPAYLRFMTAPSGSGVAAERMRITAAGNVGIGTNAPTAKLEVNGQVKITGGSPAAGKALVSDANGLASWQNTGNLTAALFMNIVTVSGSYTVAATDVTVLNTPTAAGQTITIPTAASATGRVLFLRNLSSTNTVALSQSYIQSDSQTVSSLTASTGVLIQSNGTSWYRIGF